MDTLKTSLIFFIAIFVLMSTNSDAQGKAGEARIDNSITKPQTSNLIGYYFINQEGVLFTIRIVEEEGELKGRHCWTDKRSVGEDCTPRNGRSLTLPEIINENTIQFTFRTYYGMGADSDADYFGKVQLTLQDENTLLWKITEEPDGRTIIPEELTLERYQE